MDNDTSKKIVPIGEAAKILGVSIDTVRRWDKDGTLHSQRREGKTRYFSVEELEKVNLSKPMSISEAAHKLNLSASTLIRLEKKGLIKPRRNKKGERMYDHEALEQFVKSEYFLKQKKVQDKILEPLKDQNERLEEKELENNGLIESSDPQVNHFLIGGVSAPNLFDWFVATLAIFLGASLFLFPKYSLEINLLQFIDLRMITKLSLIPAGIILIGTSIFRVDGKPLHKFSHIAILSIFGVLSYMDYVNGFLLTAMGEILISVVLLIGLFIKLEPRTRFIIFLNLLIVFAGFLIAKFPLTVAFSLVSEWIESNTMSFFLFWYLASSIILLTSFYSIIRSSGKLGYFPFFATGLGAFLFALINLGRGLWHDTIYAAVFSSFAFIFPFEKAFRSFAKYSKRESIGIFFSLSIILFVGIFFISYFQQSFKSYAFSENEKGIYSAVTTVESYVSEAKKEVSSLAERKELVSLISQDKKDSASIDELISEFYFSSSTLRRVILIDENARGISIYPRDDNFKGIDLSGRDYFHEAKETKKIVISEAISPVVPGIKASVIIAAPLFDENGNFLGVLGGSIDFVKLLSKLDSLRFGQSTYFIIADSRKNIIVHPQKEAILTQAQEGSPLAKAVEGKSGSAEEFNFSGNLSLQNFAPVRSLGWGIVTEQPLSDVLRRDGVISFLAFLTTITLGVSSILSIVYLKKR